MSIEKWNPWGISWDPFEGMKDIQREMNKLFDKSSSSGSVLKRDWSPVVDIHEDKEAYYISADLPGLNQKDIGVKVEDDVLTITGERKFEQEEKKEDYFRIEKHYGSFSRSFQLPKTANAESIKANYKDGVLKLSIPKREDSKPKQITVNVSEK